MILCDWGGSWRSMEVNKGKRFSVQAQGSYFSSESKLSAFLQQIPNHVHLFLSYLCLVGLVLAVTAGLEECGTWTTHRVSVPVSLSGAGIGELFYVTEDRISAFSAVSCAD